MILSVGVAPNLPGESYALLPDAVKNHTAHSLINQMVQAVLARTGARKHEVSYSS